MTETNTQTKPDLKIPIILMAWPGVTLVAVIILYAITALLFSFGHAPIADEPFAVDPFHAIINVMLFILGAASLLGGPASFIVGLVLLVTRIGKANEAKLAAKTEAAIKAEAHAAPQQQTSGLAIAGLILGVVGILTAWLLIGLPIGVVGICLSAIALKHPGGKGLAVSGLVTSILAVLFAIFMAFILVIVAMNGIQDTASHDEYLRSTSDGIYGGA